MGSASSLLLGWVGLLRPVLCDSRAKTGVSVGLRAAQGLVPHMGRRGKGGEGKGARLGVQCTLSAVALGDAGGRRDGQVGSPTRPGRWEKV